MQLSCLSHVKRNNSNNRPNTLPYAVDISIAVDRSGSMHTMFEETKSGLKNFVNEQKDLSLKNNVPTKLTIKTFDNIVEIMPGFDATDIQNSPDISDSSITPRNTTRLIDTACEMIIQQKNRVKQQESKISPEAKKLGVKVLSIFALLTDGLDNESKLFNPKNLNLYMTKMQNNNGKAFFLGAGQDAITIGKNLGFCPKHSLTYTSSGIQATNAMRAVTENISRAVSGNFNTEFSQLQRTNSYSNKKENYTQIKKNLRLQRC